MNKCPACGGRIPIRRLMGAPPYDCPKCAVSVVFAPWRFGVANLICLLGAMEAADLLRPHVGRIWRVAAYILVYALLAGVLWPLLLKLRVYEKKDRPLSIL